MMIKAAFDKEAKFYDDRFTFSNIGFYQRQRVYYWLDKINFFNASKKVFEINCGTGYDADEFLKRGHEVVATDASIEMINQAKVKRSQNINFYQLSFDQLEKDSRFWNSDVLFSNFGGLNCIDHKELNQSLSQWAIRQGEGDLMILVVMAKRCLWEDLYFLIKAKWNQIGRRNTDKGLAVTVEGNQVETFYHAPKTIEAIVSKTHDVILKKPIAFFLPPSYLEPFFKKNKRVLRILNNFEKSFGRISSLASWSDHYIIVAKRK